MATIETVYEGQLRTRAKHLSSGQQLITDAPLDNHGRGEAFSPTDLLSAALGSCMLTIMGIAADAHGIQLTGATVQITKIMHQQPRRVGEIRVGFSFPGLSFSDKEKKILEHAARTCPVALSLSPDLIQHVEFHW